MLDALDVEKRPEIEKRLSASDPAVRAEFDVRVRRATEMMAALTVFDVRVRRATEMMAALTVVDAVEPPSSLRSSVLASIAKQMLKRQMHGRAGFDLFGKRVLLSNCLIENRSRRVGQNQFSTVVDISELHRCCYGLTHRGRT